MIQSDRKVRMGNKGIYRNTLILDEASIIVAFVLAILIRFRAIINWVDYSAGIYISMFSTSLIFEVLVFFVFDNRRPSVVYMDPVDNLIELIKSRLLMTALLIVYFFATQKSVLASRIVMGLFLSLSVLIGFFFRMLYRKYYYRRYGVPSDRKIYEISLPLDAAKEPDSIISEVRDGNYDCVLVHGAENKGSTELISSLETAGIRTYTSLTLGGRAIRSGLISELNNYSVIPAFVRTGRCSVFGVKYCVSKTEEAVRHILSHLQELKGQYICFSNVHTTVMAREDKSYADILNGSAMTFPDGAPIASLQRRRGFPDAQRVAGPDFMEHMFLDTMDGSVGHYFYGSKEETLENLRKNLQKRYPGINIKGMYSPPFRELSKEEDREVVERINAAGADIVWIGLGAPKQEKWMNAHAGRINGVMMGVGAGFDFHAGTIQRAPQWLQKVGLEWLYRLFKDPVRLLRRYVVTNCKFFYYLVRDKRK
jgi:exopolysaccharide biosynthesis WecB/TagA/CpsF family protein